MSCSPPRERREMLDCFVRSSLRLRAGLHGRSDVTLFRCHCTIQNDAIAGYKPLVPKPLLTLERTDQSALGTTRSTIQPKNRNRANHNGHQSPTNQRIVAIFG